MSKQTALEHVEALTTELHGQGSAVSVDDEDHQVMVRCWDRRGIQVRSVSRKTRDAAVKAMLADLRMAQANAPVEVPE